MNLLLPSLLLFCLLLGAWRRVPLYDTFLAGVKEGLEMAKTLLPALLAMLCAVRVLSAAGLTEAICDFLSPFLSFLGLPREVLPLMLMKPLSGSASLALLRELLSQYGPDSKIGRTACVLMGSSETVFYTCALYLGAARVKKSRHIIPCALLAWLAGSLAAGWLTL